MSLSLSMSKSDGLCAWRSAMERVVDAAPCVRVREHADDVRLIELGRRDASGRRDALAR